MERGGSADRSLHHSQLTIGIGKVTVKELARKGATVILTSRSLEKGKVAKDEICTEILSSGKKCDIHVMSLDLSSLASVYKFTTNFKKKFSKINYLFLNAGVMACPFALSVDGYEMQFATNHLGHFFLAEELFQLMFKSDCRVIAVSSIAHTRTYPEGINFNQLNNSDNYNPMSVNLHSFPSHHSPPQVCLRPKQTREYSFLP